MEYKGKLASFCHFGYFRDMYYHIKKQVKVNLYSAKNPSDERESYFVVSNVDDSLGLLYKKRMQIEESFRDMKSLFGFKELVLNDKEQSRFEIIFLFSLIRVIKEKLRDSWVN
ncbi:MAG: family transposase, partial [Candidatus Poribacteria bacterium]|nr:family transposase [Candidatus Poribacteria bacterium]